MRAVRAALKLPEGIDRAPDFAARPAARGAAWPTLRAAWTTLIPGGAGRDGLHRLQGRTMGTGWSVALWGGARSPVDLHRAIEQALALVVAQMSHWQADSVLGRYNRAAAGSWHELPPDFGHVMAAALALAAETGGAYDPTLGPLMGLWGFGPEAGVGAAGRVPPSADTLAAARARVGWQRLRFEPHSPGRAARLLQPGGTALDLSSIAKGHAVDLVLARLREAGVRGALVEVGGELAGHGGRPDGRPWRVAVKQPGREGSSAAVLALDGGAVATSGDDFQHHAAGEGEGMRFSHTIDPRTGRPVPPRLASVTVAHPSCLQADALATALTVLGADAGPAWARQRGLAALFIARGADGFESHATPAFVERVDAVEHSDRGKRDGRGERGKRDGQDERGERGERPAVGLEEIPWTR